MYWQSEESDFGVGFPKEKKRTIKGAPERIFEKQLHVGRCAGLYVFFKEKQNLPQHFFSLIPSPKIHVTIRVQNSSYNSIHPNVYTPGCVCHQTSICMHIVTMDEYHVQTTWRFLVFFPLLHLWNIFRLFFCCFAILVRGLVSGYSTHLHTDFIFHLIKYFHTKSYAHAHRTHRGADTQYARTLTTTLATVISPFFFIYLFCFFPSTLSRYAR